MVEAILSDSRSAIAALWERFKQAQTRYGAIAQTPMENFPLALFTQLPHDLLQQRQPTACTDAKPKKTG
ncbi:MAG TPA: hypothetical protein DDW51_01455 [Cyanobacteria bacterium UBA11367]|nr:hypothetical protein [Cyanobacteria bacterium UBA11367]